MEVKRVDLSNILYSDNSDGVWKQVGWDATGEIVQVVGGTDSEGNLVKFHPDEDHPYAMSRWFVEQRWGPLERFNSNAQQA